MNASRKRLKASLVPGVRKFGPISLGSKLGEFQLFSDFFSDLADFWDLDNFWLFDLSVFDFICSDLSPPSMSLTSFMVSNMVSSFSLVASTYDDIVVFNINMSGAANLLNPWINC